jgi:kinetochore protein NDC80
VLSGTAPAPAVTCDPQDPRAEKQFADVCCQSIISYVVTKGYRSSLSPAMLKNNASFCEVVAFLARKVDPGAPPLTLAHFVEEVPALFRRLRYPFPLQKSALLAVGSPGTWPAVVAALAWLVELLRYDEAAQTAAAPVSLRDVPGGGGAEESRAFFELCTASYTHFLAGDDERVDELDDELERAQEAVDARASSLELQLAADSKALDALLASQHEQQAAVLVRNAESRGAMLRLRCGDAETLLHSLQDGKARVALQCAERIVEEERLTEELRAAVEDKMALQRSVSGQEKSAAEVAALVSDAESQHTELLRVRDLLRAAKERASVAEGGACDACGAAGAALATYNAACLALQALPATAKRAQGGAFVLHLQLSGSNPPSAPEIQATLGFMRTVVQPGLEKLRDEYRQRWQEAGVARLRLDDELDSSETVLVQRRTALHEAEACLRSSDASLAECRDRLRLSAENTEQEARTLEALTADARQLSESKLLTSEQELQHLHKIHDELAARCAAEAALTQQNVLAALDLMMAHKQAVQDSLEGCGRVLALLSADLGPDYGSTT